MPDRTPTNRLSIYLIKDEYSSPDKIIEDFEHVKQEVIDNDTTLYYSNSGNYTPKWVGTFFGASTAERLKPNLFSAYVSAVLVTRVIVSGKQKTFAVAFGLGGWHMLAAGCYEERFGLMCTLNLVSPNTLRSIEKSNMGLAPKQSQEQVSQEGEIADFGIDIEQDLIRSVTGKCKNKDLGSTVTGKDSLHVSAKTDLSNVKSMLSKYFVAYESVDYKQDFGWVDYVSEVKDPILVEQLHVLLDAQLADGQSDKIWLAVPDVMEWSDVSGFYYQNNRGQVYTDLFMKNLREAFAATGLDVTVKNLKSHKAYALSASNDRQFRGWRLYNCLYAEITDLDTDKLYMLSNGKWYGVENDFVTQINQSFTESLSTSVLQTTCNHGETEEQYNIRAAAAAGIICMDRKMIQHGGGNSKIEFCDLYDPNSKTLIHVKKYGGSSVLSHLFNQGLVSGELMLSDQIFRQKVNEKLPSAAHFANVEEKPQASEFQVVYAIISGSKKVLDIPFFSKVSLRNAKRRLELIGYNVTVQKIDLIKDGGQ